MLPIEKRGMADRADADATAFVGDAVAELGPFVALGAEETELHELVGAEELLQLGEKARSEAAAAKLEGGFERLTKTTQVRALRAREREFVHENEHLMA